VQQCVEQAAADLTVATTLMEARLIVGPKTLFEAMREAVGPKRIWSPQEFFAEKRREQIARHHRYHDTGYNLEPNVKGSPGGLRDIQMIGWVAKRHFGVKTFDELVEHNFLSPGQLRRLKGGQAREGTAIVISRRFLPQGQCPETEVETFLADGVHLVKGPIPFLTRLGAEGGPVGTNQPAQDVGLFGQGGLQHRGPFRQEFFEPNQAILDLAVGQLPVQGIAKQRASAQPFVEGGYRHIAGIGQLNDRDGTLDPLLAANSWRACHLVDNTAIRQRNYVRFTTDDAPGVIGRIGSCFGDQNVSIQSIVQFDASDAGAEIVVITHEVSNGAMQAALTAITALPEVRGIAAHLGCL